MHLAVCVRAKKLPLPARLPKCLLRRAPSDQQQRPLEASRQRQQQQQQGGEPAPGREVEEGKEPKKQKKETALKEKKTKKGKPSGSAPPAVDLKRATKEFKNGGMKAEDFLPVLQVGKFWMGVPCSLVFFSGKAVDYIYMVNDG